MSCSYCTGGVKKPLLNGDAFVVRIEDDELDILSVIDCDREVVRINFCPI